MLSGAKIKLNEWPAKVKPFYKSKKQYLDRIDEPEKNWKFSLADLQERQYWEQYMQAYEACLNATSTDDAPWYAVPADDKHNARLIVSQIVLDAFDNLKIAYPMMSEERCSELKAIRRKLQKEHEDEKAK